jgi:hypothetical protein
LAPPAPIRWRHVARRGPDSSRRPTAPAEPICPVCIFKHGASVEDPPTIHAAALLVVHGDFTFIGQQSACRIPCLSGMGCFVLAGERYTLESDSGAIKIDTRAANVFDFCGKSGYLSVNRNPR